MGMNYLIGGNKLVIGASNIEIFNLCSNYASIQRSTRVQQWDIYFHCRIWTDPKMESDWLIWESNFKFPANLILSQKIQTIFYLQCLESFLTAP